jgi:bacteriorhodopsin
MEITNKSLINKTAKLSLGAQIITGIIDAFALKIDIPKELSILKQLLFLELVVQIIEGIFYIWLVKSFHTVDNITKFRYYDWSLSTPIMLFTLICYIVHLKEPTKTLKQIYIENKFVINKVIVLNYMMLYLGYLGEINKINIKTSVYLGFIPFITYYIIIYDKYIKDLDSKLKDENKKKEIKLLYYYFLIFWSIYGVAALLPYTNKNIMYNILDLFSKNFFGIFLSYTVYKNRIKNNSS